MCSIQRPTAGERLSPNESLNMTPACFNQIRMHNSRELCYLCKIRVWKRFNFIIPPLQCNFIFFYAKRPGHCTPRWRFTRNYWYRGEGRALEERPRINWSWREVRSHLPSPFKCNCGILVILSKSHYATTNCAHFHFCGYFVDKSVFLASGGWFKIQHTIVFLYFVKIGPYSRTTN